jgi:two-component system, chemotaxis family, CheB/CheR fusion protein
MTDKQEKPVPACPIVALGASAGGIQALTAFFNAMPEDPGIAFVVVLHLSPSHESHLVNVLQRTTSLDVVQVHRSVRIKANCIYVISPNSVLTISEDQMRARGPRNDFERRHPVDAIFQSLAEKRGREAVCIILSGSGSNGSAGAQAVRERDGVVLAQQPETAEHPEMPRNVILAGLADRVLPPEQIPAVLLNYLRGSRTELQKSDEELAASAEADLNMILAVLRTRGHYDFEPYRKKTLLRRTQRRMGLAQIGSFRHYAEKLRNDPEEVQALIGDLLINVTSFFRDPEAWDDLCLKVIAPLVASRDERQPIRVWTPACSSGEEAYTVAMLLLEQTEDQGKELDIKVFATDAAPQALARARAGLFPASIAEAIPRDRLNRFFDQEEDRYRAKKSLRELVIFAPQNMLADPPFSRLDIVSCRNLLIYLEPQVQERVIALLHFSLREGGVLFLGSAETVGRHTELFHPLSKKWRIYRRVGVTRHELVDFPLLGAEHADAGAGAEGIPPRAPADQAREALLTAFAPPAVLIDEQLRVLYFHGELDTFLKTPSGEPTLDVLSLAREELRPKLRAAIRQVSKEKIESATEAKLRSGGQPRIRLKVIPVSPRNSAGRFLVSFEEKPPLPATRTSKQLDERALSEGQLEEELRTAREELRLSIEQLETSNEELKASNEEIISMNEELQSTNEELETSKEELQSLNEELNTVNTQLQSKVDELEDRTNDLNNLLNSTDIATLFLDDHFRIRWFSPPVRNLFQVIQTDIGRPITDIAQSLHDETFIDDAKDVLRTLQPKEKEVQGSEGRWHFRRILPYRTDDNRIDGVVVTFSEITERKRGEEALESAKEYAERIVDTTRQPLVVLDKSLSLRSANRAFHECFRLSPGETAGKSLFELNNGDWAMPRLRQALRNAIPDSGIVNDLEVTHEFRELGRRHLLVNARKLDDDDSILVAIEDVTGRKESEANREALLAELRHRIKNLLTKVSAVVTLSRPDGLSTVEYAADLKQRIAAIARTEELIGGRTEEIGLRELAVAETAGVNGGDRSIQIEGPDVMLTAEQAQTIALALHELATNALKYGALAQQGGNVSMRWALASEGEAWKLALEWTETGVAAQPPSKTGFGSRLLREIVPHMLGGSGQLKIDHGGARYLLTFPLEGVPSR